MAGGGVSGSIFAAASARGCIQSVMAWRAYNHSMVATNFSRAILIAAALLCGTAAWAQSPKQPPVPKSDPVPRSQSDDTSTDAQKDSAQPTDKSANPDNNADAKAKKDAAKEQESEAPPPSANESSSKDSRGDTTPPPDDKRKHPDSAAAIQELEGTDDAGDGSPEHASKPAENGAESKDEDVNEFHPWDPHRAMKDIEVGDYYFKRKNYIGAESRYREALLYKPGDAIATFQLAVCLDKTGRAEEARQNYAAYLRILPNGPSAAEAKLALSRLGEPTAKNGKSPK